MSSKRGKKRKRADDLKAASRAADDDRARDIAKKDSTAVIFEIERAVTDDDLDFSCRNLLKKTLLPLAKGEILRGAAKKALRVESKNFQPLATYPPASKEPVEQNDNALTVKECIKFIFKLAKTKLSPEGLKTLVVWVSGNGFESLSFLGSDYTDVKVFKNRMKTSVKNFGEVKKIRIEASDPLLRIQELLPPFLAKNIHRFFHRDIEGLKRMLLEKTLPIRRAKYSPQSRFVQANPTNPGRLFVSPVSADKAAGIVIAGESGSGKSVMSCQLAMENDYTVIYFVMEERHMLGRPEPDKYPILNKFIGNFIKSTDDDELYHFRPLFHLKSKLNTNRNTWAEKTVERAMMLGFSGGQFDDYFEGNWPVPQRPKKVAIVIDEATDLQLAEGIIDSVRILRSNYLGKLAQDDVLIVITGTGLDDMKDPKHLGTDPTKSRLVMMKHPKLEELSNQNVIGNTVKQAIERGAISRVLATNTRMLFTSILPFMLDERHKKDSILRGRDNLDRRYRERLIRLGGVPDVMDHAVRTYVNDNSVGKLNAREKDTLLSYAFEFHQKRALEKIRHVGSSSVKKNFTTVYSDFSDVWEKAHENDIPFHLIYQRGIVSREGTSNALKYLACFGLAETIGTYTGTSFERVVSLHMMRLAEVSGSSSTSHTLKYAWPPAYTRSGSRDDSLTYSQEELESLRRKLKDQARDELDDFDFGNFMTGDHCIVFSQGTATAQGADRLVLYIFQEGTIYLEPMQCKYTEKSPPSTEALVKAGHSLGVDELQRPNNLTPNHGPAGYSYIGLEMFLALLNDKLQHYKRGAEIGLRIVTTPRDPTNAQHNVQIPEGITVFYRAMLEPTISSLMVEEDEKRGEPMGNTLGVNPFFD